MNYRQHKTRPKAQLACTYNKEWFFFILVKTKTEKNTCKHLLVEIKNQTLKCVSVCCLLANQFSLKSDQKCLKVNTITINLKEKCKTLLYLLILPWWWARKMGTKRLLILNNLYLSLKFSINFYFFLWHFWTFFLENGWIRSTKKSLSIAKQ